MVARVRAVSVASVRDGIDVVHALAAYRRTVVPVVREGLGRWEALAEAIPDPILREQALLSLREKGLNVEATAVFGILAPRRHRRAAVEAMTALQVAVDYLDTLGEEQVDEPLANGLRLHGALVAALAPGDDGSGADSSGGTRAADTDRDWYALHPRREDGGYLAALVDACRQSVARLPAAEVALPAARRAAARCGAGQSHTHAAELGDREALREWAPGLDAPPGYAWWEVAAGASSSVAAHALIAAAADPGTTAATAELVDTAYFPPVGALTVLLDDLVDRDEDEAAGAHNYVAYYRDREEAANRLALLAARARAAIAPLPRRRRHKAILTGVAGFYLAAPGADTEFARPAAAALEEALGPAIRPIVATMRRRRTGH
jgi:tetraprenyl-beta-curcumene synthase